MKENKKKNKITYIIIVSVLIIMIITLLLLFLLKKSDKYTISLVGGDTLILYNVSDFTDPGFKVIDSNNKDVSDKVTIDSNIDVTKNGEYTIKYSIDNDVLAERKVIIKEAIKRNISFTLLGDKEMVVTKNAKYEEPGFLAIDQFNKNYNDLVIISGTVDTKTVGNYELTYSLKVDDDEKVLKRKVSVVSEIIDVTKVELLKSSLLIKIGEKKKIDVTISPDNATDKAVTWTSSNKAVATVTSDGYVTGVKEGETEITVTSKNGKTSKCTVTVVADKIDVTEIKVLKSSLLLKVGGKDKIDVTISPDNATDKSVTWTSSNKAVATVTSDGYVTGVKEGEVEITVTSSDGKSAKCKVTIDGTAPVINSCTASVSYNATTKKYDTKYIVNATDKNNIVKYVHNKKEYKEKEFVVSNDVEDDTVTVYDSVGNSKSILCQYAPIEKKSTSKLVSGASYDSNTLKYWIEKPYDRFTITHIWVKNGYNQIKTELNTDKPGTLKKSADFLESAISKNGYQKKGMIALNASGFIMETKTSDPYWKFSGWKESDYKHSSRSPLIIYNGSVLRDWTMDELPTEKLYTLYGLKSSGYLKFYNYIGGSSSINYNKQLTQKVINDKVKYTFYFNTVLISNYLNMVANETSSTYTTPDVRQALCQIDRNNFAIVTTLTSNNDSNKLNQNDRNNGFSHKGMAKKMEELNCREAYNLDGGGSVSLYYKTSSSQINNIRSSSRKVTDILYFVEQ